MRALALAQDYQAAQALVKRATPPGEAIIASYERIGLEFSDRSRAAVGRWADQHEPGSHGSHTYALTDFGIDADAVREKFASYIAAYAATG